MEEAKKSRKLRWTDERREQLEDLKQVFNDLQSLYFIVEGGTVKVYTDASDYYNRRVREPDRQWKRATGWFYE